VSCIVKRHLKNGFAVNFLNGLEGVVDWFHLPSVVSHHKEMCDLYPLNSTLKLRILHCDKRAKKVYLSGLSHVLELRMPNFDGICVGDFQRSVSVHRVDREMGLLVKLSDRLSGYVHLYRISDEKLTSLTKKQYQVNTKVDARVVALNYLEGYVCLSMQPSVMSAPFLHLQSVEIGSYLTGTVEGFKEKGVVVWVTNKIRGIIPNDHLSDTSLTDPARRFPKCSKVKCRVLSLDVSKQKLLLTAKRTLLTSKYPLISSLTGAKRGLISHGVVSKVLATGRMVSFYNNVKGYLSLEDIRSSDVDPSELSVGRVVCCTVVHCNMTSGRISLSLNTSQERHPPDFVAFASIKPGDLVTCVVHSRSKRGLRVRMEPSNVLQVIETAHLSDHYSICEPLLEAYSRHGTILENVLVLSVSKRKALLSLKKSFKANFSLDEKELHPGQCYYGFIQKIVEYGCYVRLCCAQSCGFVTLTNMAERYISKTEEIFKLGQTVLATVLSNNGGKLHLTLKSKPVEDDRVRGFFMATYIEDKAVLESRVCALLPISSLLIVEKALARKPLDGVVKAVESYGVTVKFSDDITGFATPEHCPSGLTVGSRVQGAPLDVDMATLVIDVSLRADVVGPLCSPPTESIGQEHLSFSVLLVKSFYLLCLARDNLLVVPVASFNTVSEKAFTKYSVGQTFSGRVIGQVVATPLAHSFLSRLLCATIEQSSTLHCPLKKKISRSLAGIPPVEYIGDVKQGQIVKCRVNKIEDFQLNIDLSPRVKGRVHITECSRIDMDNPLSVYHRGQYLRARVLGLRCTKTHSFLPVSHTQGKAIVELTCRERSATASLGGGVLLIGSLYQRHPERRRGSTPPPYFGYPRAGRSDERDHPER
jgi:rRNA biogenesis protein RRP5